MITLEDLVDVAEILAQDHPEGRRPVVGDDYVNAHCINPDHNDDTPSMTLRIMGNGKWAVNCHGCGMESLALRGLLIKRFSALADRKPKPEPVSSKATSQPAESSPSQQPSDELPLIKRLAPKRTKVLAWIPIHDCSDAVFQYHYELLDHLMVTRGEITTPYYYTNKAGHVIGLRLRFSDPMLTSSKGKPPKTFSWLNTFVVDNNGKPVVRYMLKEMPDLAPVYRRHLIDPDQPLLIVEGEKTADVAANRFPTLSVTTWATGKALSKTDWKSIIHRGQRVIVWTDNDLPGRQYILGTPRQPGLGKLLTAFGARVQVVDLKALGIDRQFPEGWDLADPPPANWSDQAITELLEKAQPIADWFSLDAMEVCKLKAFDPTIDVHKSCTEHWNDERLETDPYGIGVALPAQSMEPPGREAYLIDGRLPVGRCICNACPYAGLAESPAAIAALEPVYRKAVFVGTWDKVYDLSSSEVASRMAFNGTMRHAYPKEKPFDLLMEREGQVISRVTNIVNARRIIEHETNGRMLNLWRPGRHMPPAITETWAPNLWLQVAELAIPDEEARNFVFDWIAYQFQQPNMATNFLPIVSGGQGTGKDSLFKPMHALLGHNMQLVTNAMLKSQFNEYMLAQVVLLQELDFMDWSIYNKLKAQITTSHLQINNKGIPRYAVEHRPNLIATSNAFNPLPLEQDDRRIWLYRSPLTMDDMEKQGIYGVFNEFYDGKSGYMSQLEPFLYWALSRDLSQFNPSRAPMTANKMEVIHDSMPDIGQILFEMVSENRIDKPVLRTLDIKMLAQRYLSVKQIGPKRFNFLMRKSGMRYLGKIEIGKGRMTSLYCFTREQITKLALECSEEFGSDILAVERLANELPDDATLAERSKAFRKYIYIMDDD